MEVIIISIVVFSLAMFGLAIGTIINGKQIKGHCGGASVEEDCIKDSQGNKIQCCPDCSCDSQ